MDIRIYEVCEMWSGTCLKSSAQLIQLNVCVRGESIRLVQVSLTASFFHSRKAEIELKWW